MLNGRCRDFKEIIPNLTKPCFLKLIFCVSQAENQPLLISLKVSLSHLKQFLEHSDLLFYR